MDALVLGSALLGDDSKEHQSSQACQNGTSSLRNNGNVSIAAPQDLRALPPTLCSTYSVSGCAISMLLAMPRLAAVSNPSHRYIGALKVEQAERLKTANIRLVRQEW